MSILQHHIFASLFHYILFYSKYNTKDKKQYSLGSQHTFAFADGCKYHEMVSGSDSVMDARNFT